MLICIQTDKLEVIQDLGNHDKIWVTTVTEAKNIAHIYVYASSRSQHVECKTDRPGALFHVIVGSHPVPFRPLTCLAEQSCVAGLGAKLELASQPGTAAALAFSEEACRLIRSKVSSVGYMP